MFSPWVGPRFDRAAIWSVALHNLATRLGLHILRAANPRMTWSGRERRRVAPDRGVRGMGVSGATSAYRGVGGP
jgi:hypothetical protein